MSPRALLEMRGAPPRPPGGHRGVSPRALEMRGAPPRPPGRAKGADAPARRLRESREVTMFVTSRIYTDAVTTGPSRPTMEKKACGRGRPAAAEAGFVRGMGG